MKELSIEQKAQRYDEAIERLRNAFYDNNSRMCEEYRKAAIKILEPIFPELQVSEDEKIKKWIKKELESKYVVDNIVNDVMADKALAWIEKQGKQKPDDNRLIPQKGEYYVCIKDYYSADGKTTNTKGKIYKSPCDGYINDDKGFGLSWINSCTENHFRPIKEEDWIICEQNNVIGKPLQYKEFMNNKLIQKNIKSLEDKGFVPNFRLWDISDAKDGDVLSFNDGHGNDCIELIKSITDKKIEFWFCLTNGNRYEVFDGIIPYTNLVSREGATPATKEQRDTLEKAMADAGWEFDFEKKELKKIVVPIFNIGDTIAKKHNSDIHDFGSFTITDITGGKYWYNDRIICDILEQDEWENYEPVRQKPAWNEEDKEKLDNAVYACINIYGKDSPTVDWLKSLKDRVQPKQEWSEEDKAKIVKLKSFIAQCKGFNKENRNKAFDLIDSIKPRYTWKPSDKQIAAIEYIIKEYESTTIHLYDGAVKQLYSLLNDLKRL